MAITVKALGLPDIVITYGDPRRLMQIAALQDAIGGPKAYESLWHKLTIVNGRRKDRTMMMSEVWDCIAEALTPEPCVAVHCGGHVSKSKYTSPKLTTLCMAVGFADYSVAVDVVACQAYRPTPACVWPELAPWPYTPVSKLHLQHPLVDEHDSRILAWAEARRPYPKH